MAAPGDAASALGAGFSQLGRSQRWCPWRRGRDFTSRRGNERKLTFIGH